MSKSLTIVVGGYIVGYPLGGMTWHHLNYLLGLHEMGHEVWFLEDSGDFSIPYNPQLGYNEIDPTYGINYLKETFAAYGLPERYCYYSRFWDMHYGMAKEELNDLLRRADLLLCVSGVTPLRAERARPRRTCVIDTDPVFTQIRMGSDPAFFDYYKSFDSIASFGALVGTSVCPLPTHGLRWIPTVQPLALRHWPVLPAESDRFTTIGKWEHSNRDVVFNGHSFRSSKGPEWIKMLDLPGKVPWKMELAMQSMPKDVMKMFREGGWTISSPEPASISPQSFQKFIQGSAGEFTVAKEIYAGLPSGWFSDRAACYLASGRPVVTQRSGFEHWLPTGEGAFAYTTPDEAVDALQAIHADYGRHSTTARRLAETHFEAKKVLTTLLDAVM